jgi:myosin heavy subunit
MDATNIFENLLQQIQSSHLNFKLELSPFSANISLKKSFIRNKSGTPLLQTFSEFCSRKENTNVGVSVSENHETKIKLLEDQVRQLEVENATLIGNYDEEILESEALTNKLNDALERLDNLQNNFSKLESKHIKTCSELKSLKGEHDGLKQELTRSKIVIKTQEKETSESNKEHQKTVKKKDDTIENLTRYKTLKDSEEKELKIKERKLNKKLKQVVERESKLRLVKHDLNKNEVVTKTETSKDNDVTTRMSLTESIAPQHSLKSHSDHFLTMASYNYMSNSTTFPSMVSHFLPLLPDFTPDKLLPIPMSKITSMRKTDSDSKSDDFHGPKSGVWNCAHCAETFPRMSTLDQAFHKIQHLCENLKK